MPKLPPLVDADTLYAHRDDPDLRILDASIAFLPGEPDERAVYDREHIPGAAFVDLRGALSDPDSAHSFTVPTPERFAAAAGELGIGPGTHVVVYAQNWPIWATRMWWLLRFFGFDDVSVLDGGLEAWRRAGHPLTDAPPAYPRATFTPRPRPELLATIDEVAAASADGGACIVNALPEAIFTGEQPATDGRHGRIPASVNTPWTRLADLETGVFKPLAQQRAALEEIGALNADRPVIAYCGGGVSATLDLFSLSMLGVDDAKLYDGSLSEWLADPSRPVQTG